MAWGNCADVEELVGKTLTEVSGMTEGHPTIDFVTEDGVKYQMLHHQDCCEDVRLEDIHGDPEDLVGSPITMAEEVSASSSDSYGSTTWTFYKFATAKGYVTLRWYGQSNGYYSERVDFERMKKEDETDLWDSY